MDRKFVAERPNTLWVADVTYVPTGEGFLYLAVVLDVFSRLIVGWAVSDRLKSELVMAAKDAYLRSQSALGRDTEVAAFDLVVLELFVRSVVIRHDSPAQTLTNPFRQA